MTFTLGALRAKPCPWSCKESDITEQRSTHIQQNSQILGGYLSGSKSRKWVSWQKTSLFTSSCPAFPSISSRAFIQMQGNAWETLKGRSVLRALSSKEWERQGPFPHTPHIWVRENMTAGVLWAHCWYPGSQSIQCFVHSVNTLTTQLLWNWHRAEFWGWKCELDKALSLKLLRIWYNKYIRKHVQKWTV